MHQNPQSNRLADTLDEVARRGMEQIDDLVRAGRETLQRQAEAQREIVERDYRARAVMALLQVAPELRRRYPQALRAAFDRDLNDAPVSTVVDSVPTSLRFDQLELMDEQQVQDKISAVRGVQQVLLESEAEIAELNALVSAMQGYAYVRPERNPLRPELFLDTLRDLLNEMPGDSRTHSLWSQVLLPQLGRQLRDLYREILDKLRWEKVQPARYAINQGAQGGGAPRRPSATPAGMPADPGSAGGAAYADAYGAVPMPPGTVAVPAGLVGLPPGTVAVPAQMMMEASVLRWPAERQVAPDAAAPSPRLTVQQLHGLVSGTTENSEQLAQEVVNLLIANIAGDPRVLPQVWQLVYQLEPALLALAKSDREFFHDKQHPARQLLEEVVQRSFAYPSADAPGVDTFLGELQMAFGEIDADQVRGPAPFAAALDRLRRQWTQVEQGRKAQQQAAVQALQQAERRNEMARQIADHIQQQAETVLVPDLVVEFACGPWAQVMAQARMDGSIDQRGEPDYVALLEDLFWSVRPDQTRERPGHLMRMIPKLIQGLRSGLARINYPAEDTQAFFSHLFNLHQGSLEGISAARSVKVAPSPSTKTWLAPKEAQDSGFMDDLDTGHADDHPSGDVSEFAATQPMGIVDRESTTGRAHLEPVEAAETLALERLSTGDWVELKVDAQWSRLQLAWVNEQATLCLFSSSTGANHSMTRRMFDRLVAQGNLRLISQGAVVDRAFDAVAQLAMRNSVSLDGNGTTQH